MEYVLYHGSIKSFSSFDESKINPYETDAFYNGFWFSSRKSTSPAFKNAKFLKTCIVTINNPAPLSVIKNTIKELKNSNLEGFRSLQDAVRLRLVELGYDGIIFDDIPVIDAEELNAFGRTEYYSARGSKYILENDEEYHGLDLLDGDGEHITGYCDLDDFLSQQEQTVVVFKNEQIIILEEVPVLRD